VKIYKLAITTIKLFISIVGLFITFEALWFSVTKIEMSGCGNGTMGASCDGPHWGVFGVNTYTLTVILLIVSSFRFADILANSAKVRGILPRLFRFALTIMFSMTAFWIGLFSTVNFLGKPSLQMHLVVSVFAVGVEGLRVAIDETRPDAGGGLARLSLRKGKIEKIALLTTAFLIGAYFVWDAASLQRCLEGWFLPSESMQGHSF
jgi:hypothetical protein